MLKRTPVLILALASACGVGAEYPSARLADTAAPAAENLDMDFAAWCQAWQIDCPSTVPDVPNSEAPWSAEQWRALFGVFEGIGLSRSQLVLSSTELNDRGLQAVVNALGLGEHFQRIKTRLDDMNFASIEVQPGKRSAGSGKIQGRLNIVSTAPSTLVGDSGLTMNQGTNFSLSIAPDRSIALAGLELGSRTTRAVERVQTLAVEEANVLTMNTAKASISGVPMAYIAEEYLHLEDGQLPEPQLRYGDLIPVGYQFYTWLTTGIRDIDLGSVTMQRLASELPILLPELDAGVPTLLKAITSVKSTRATRASQFIKAETRGPVQCQVGDKLEINIEREFGIRTLTRLDATSFRITVYGIKVKPLNMPIQPNFRLNRIDFEPTRIVIRDVPVLGQYVFEMGGDGGGGGGGEQGPPADMSLSCH